MGGHVSTREQTSERTDVVTHVLRIRLPPLDTLIPITLVAFVVIWRTWAVLQWSFQGDDWTYVAQAVRVPFLQFITMQHNGHLQPGQFTLVWVVSRIAPLNFGVAMAPLLALSFIGGLLMWRFLAALFGDQPANLIPLAAYMLCPLSLPSSFWWAAALTILPLQVFIVATLFAVLLYVRDRSILRLASAGLVYSGAVIFWEKAVLILPLTVLFVFLFLGQGSGGARLRSVSIRLWQLWAVLAGITLAYAGWYVAVAKGEVAGAPTLLQLQRLVGKTFGSTIIPTYLGGPWSVSALGKAFVSELPLLARLAAWLVAGLIVAVSLLRYRHAWRGWTLPILYIGFSTALVAVGRLPLIGAGSGLGSRYYADSVAVFAIGLALAFMVPLDRKNDRGWSPRVFILDAGPARARWPIRLRGVRRRSARPPIGASRKFAIVVTLVYAISALITSFRMAGVAQTDSAKDWLATVRTELRRHPRASVVDGYLPATAAPPALDQAKLSWALAPIAPNIRWNAPDEHPLIFDGGGQLWPVQVGSATKTHPGPIPNCGYRTGGAPISISLERPLFSWSWGVRLAYSSLIRDEGSVTVDGDRQYVRYLRGSHVLILFHRGTATSVTIDSQTTPICVRALQVGLVKPSLPSR